VTYRDNHALTIADLKLDEQLAFGTLLRRVMIDNLDRQAEAQLLDALATELGEDEFWIMIDRAVEEMETPDQAHALATGVKRRSVQSLIYAVVAEVAMVGTMSAGQMAILDELQRMWGIEIQKIR
jgi:hypothetical protein